MVLWFPVGPVVVFLFFSLSWGRWALEVPRQFGCWDLHRFSPQLTDHRRAQIFTYHACQWVVNGQQSQTLLYSLITDLSILKFSAVANFWDELCRFLSLWLSRWSLSRLMWQSPPGSKPGSAHAAPIHVEEALHFMKSSTHLPLVLRTLLRENDLNQHILILKWMSS